MKPEKKGYCFPPELANFVWDLHRITKLNRNKVVIRCLEIARQDLAPFEGKALAAVFRDPWEAARQLPTLRRQMEKRGHGLLSSVVAARLTTADRIALDEFTKNHKTTISAGLRQIVHRILATEGPR